MKIRFYICASRHVFTLLAAMADSTSSLLLFSRPDLEGTRREQRGPRQQLGAAARGELPSKQGLGRAGLDSAQHAQVIATRRVVLV